MNWAKEMVDKVDHYLMRAFYGDYRKMQNIQLYRDKMYSGVVGITFVLILWGIAIYMMAVYIQEESKHCHECPITINSPS